MRVCFVRVYVLCMCACLGVHVQACTCVLVSWCTVMVCCGAGGHASKHKRCFICTSINCMCLRCHYEIYVIRTQKGAKSQSGICHAGVFGQPGLEVLDLSYSFSGKLCKINATKVGLGGA